MGAVRRCVNLVDLEKCFKKMSVFLQNSVSIKKRTSPLKFDHFRYPEPDFTASDLSTKPETFFSVVCRSAIASRRSARESGCPPTFPACK